MLERPRFPIGLLLTWLAVVVDGVALYWLFRSGQPLYLKLAIGGAEVVGAFAILTFYLGRLREWVRAAEKIRALEREVQRLRQRDAATVTPEAASRKAA